MQKTFITAMTREKMKSGLIPVYSPALSQNRKSLQMKEPGVSGIMEPDHSLGLHCSTLPQHWVSWCYAEVAAVVASIPE